MDDRGWQNGDHPVDDDEDDEPVDPSAAAEAERIAAEAVAGTLTEALADLAAADDAIAVRPSGTITEYLVSGLAFARADGSTASFRLRPEIVAAAIRTDGTAASTLGREWVAFSPRRWDRYALDRAIAWFLLARRLAGERR
jgi:hypothetical protein